MSVDAHCHIDLHPNPKETFEALIADEVLVVAVTTTPAAFKGSSRFMDATSGIFPAVGFHPEVVGSRPNDLKLMNNYIQKVQWVGEIGLDGSKRFSDSYSQQKLAFEKILSECQLAGGRTLSIHSRNAADDVLDCLGRHPSAGVAVLHWFSGTEKQLRRAIEADCYFSVNDQMLSTNKGRNVLSKIPLDRLLTESDAPFASSKSKLSISDRIRECEKVIAETLGKKQHAIVRSIEENFHRINVPARRV